MSVKSFLLRGHIARLRRNRELRGAVNRWGRAALELLYPPTCMTCGAEIDRPHALCPVCWRGATFIGPPLCGRCGLPIDAAAEPGESLTCDDCHYDPPAFARCRSAMLYEGAGRDLALALKHAGKTELAPPAAAWMLREGRPLAEAADLIAPVPLHPLRLIARRYNQSAELARTLARQTGRPFAPDLLQRTRRTPSQDGRSRAERRANVAGAIRVAPRWESRAQGARVLVVDDVMTTGATLDACARACLDAGCARVEAATLARVALRRNISI